MLVLNSGQKVPIKLWMQKESDLELGAQKQAENLASLPFAFKHVAIMPDAHQGYGMPIGGVLATDGVVIPNAVGVDIGCGMCALRTNFTELATPILKQIVARIRETVPVGFSHYKEPCDESLMPMRVTSAGLLLGGWAGNKIVSREWEKALYQLGTLGGGNHFIEIQRGSDDYIWIMLHSGSRNLGKQVADHYNKVAVELNAKWHSSVPKEWQLAFLPLDSEEGQEYLSEMNYCVEFALANRKHMMEQVLKAIYSVHFEEGLPYQKVSPDDMFNIAHNYAAMENHFGQNVMVHRKGATRARLGETGIIPGSQGTKSYIVTGKGDPMSFQSCSHGAGRKMGRKEACRQLSLEDTVRDLDSKGVVHGIRKTEDLDEAPGAYKDIDVVMANQTDLVAIAVELTPLAVVKG